MYGVKPWQCAFGGGQCALTGGLTHYLTPFGYMIGAYGMARAPGAGIVAGVNMYANGRLALPEINVSLVDVPVVFASPGLFWSPRLSLWLQPSDQRFYDNAAAAGGLMSQRLDIRLSRFASLYTELEAKSEGMGLRERWTWGQRFRCARARYSSFKERESEPPRIRTPISDRKKNVVLYHLQVSSSKTSKYTNLHPAEAIILFLCLSV